MRAYTCIGLLMLGVFAAVTAPPATGQNPFQKKGFGGGGGGKMQMDPNAQFDMYARDRGFFLISETRSLQQPLTQYANEKGITNGQITREQFLDFSKTRTPGGPGGPGGQGPGGFFRMMNPGGGPPGPFNISPEQSPDIMNQLADADFKRRDANGDGKLNTDEMPEALKTDLAKWDTNNDGLIDLQEYRAYFISRLSGGQAGGPAATPTVVTINIEEDDWDRKPIVLRAGNLPKKGLPAWFKELDTDGDGQVALYEWRKANKPLDEFREWDADDDGFITPEEAMKYQIVLVASKNKSKAGPVTVGTVAANIDPSESSAETPRPGGGGASLWGNKGWNKEGKGGKDKGGKDKGANPFGGFFGRGTGGAGANPRFGGAPDGTTPAWGDRGKKKE